MRRSIFVMIFDFKAAPPDQSDFGFIIAGIVSGRNHCFNFQGAEKGKGKMETIKVMIVDDENLAVEDLLDLVDWESLGFTVVATASNGKRALAKFRQHRPRLVITDIKMPVMDGIELIREIRKLDPNVKFLLLSAYSEFEYAKEAMRLGVKEYVIKNEINQKSFSEKLIQLRREIVFANQTSHYFINSYIRSIFSGKEAAEDLNDRTEENGGPAAGGKYYFIILEQDYPLPVLFHRIHSNTSEEESAEPWVELTGIRLNGFSVDAAAWLRSGRTVVLVSAATPVPDYLLHSHMKEFCSSLTGLIRNKAGISTSAFYFSEKMGIREAAKSYQKSKARISVKYLRQPQGVYAFDNIPADCMMEKQPPDTSAVAQAVRYEDAEKARQEVRRIFERVRTEDSYACLAMVSSQLLTILESAWPDKNSFEEFCNREDTEAQLCCLDGISLYFQKAFPAAIDSRKKAKTYSKEVFRAIDYIRRNYADESLSIKDIADEIPLSVTRLSVVFKNEVGKTILNYITEYRVQKAKQMLDEGTYKVYEIAEKVGYSSSQYFSQVFTNLVGVGPKEYKSRHG
jgi:YesN/AraC family two-component response regulator